MLGIWPHISSFMGKIAKSLVLCAFLLVFHIQVLLWFGSDRRMFSKSFVSLNMRRETATAVFAHQLKSLAKL